MYTHVSIYMYFHVHPFINSEIYLVYLGFQFENSLRGGEVKSEFEDFEGATYRVI